MCAITECIFTQLQRYKVFRFHQYLHNHPSSIVLILMSCGVMPSIRAFLLVLILVLYLALSLPHILPLIRPLLTLGRMDPSDLFHTHYIASTALHLFDLSSLNHAPLVGRLPPLCLQCDCLAVCQSCLHESFCCTL